MKIKFKVRFLLAITIVTLLALALVVIGGIMFFGSLSGNYPFLDAILSMKSDIAIVLYLLVLLMLIYGAIPMVLGIGIILAEVVFIRSLIK